MSDSEGNQLPEVYTISYEDVAEFHREYEKAVYKEMQQRRIEEYNAYLRNKDFVITR